MSQYIWYDKNYESAHTNMYDDFVVTNLYILNDQKLRIHTHEYVLIAQVTISFI